MGLHSELSAWLIPPAAQDEWLRLSTELDAGDAVPCRSGDSGAWWPDAKQLDSPTTRTAVDACRSCRARAACLDYALAADERFGIWGGTLPAERKAAGGGSVTGRCGPDTGWGRPTPASLTGRD